MNKHAANPGVGRRITRYGAILALSGALCHVLRLVYTLMAINILGQEQFGRIEYFVEMAVIFTVLLDFGLEQTLTREIARRKERLKTELPSIIGYRIAATIAGAFVMIGFLVVIAKPEHSLGIILAAGVYFCVVSMIMVVKAISRSFELMAAEGIANFLDKFAHISAAIVLLLVYPNLPLLLLCYSLGSLVSLLFFAVLLYRRVHLESRIVSLGTGWSWQKLAFPIGLSAACVLLLHRQDTAMVNWICGDAETGLYRAPYRFLEGLFLVPQVIAVSAYPVFSKLFHQNHPFEQTASVLMRGLLIMSLPMAIGGTIIGHDIMLWAAPELGRMGGDVFVVLVWSLPFIYLNFLLGAILNATDRQSKNFRASAISMMSNLVFNIPFIIYFGAIGAAVMTVISQGLYAVLMLWHTRDFQLIREFHRYAAILFSCVVMAAVLILTPMPWLLDIAVGGMIYFIVLLLSKGLSSNDRQKLMQVLSKSDQKNG
ncbi:MAG: flippase [Candidatus Hinthialibacter antarcticus]|nr:flippase [Candidatus Hinthialibacter antarcticus]